MGNIPKPADRLEPSPLTGKFFPAFAFRVQHLPVLPEQILISAGLFGRGYQASGHPAVYGHCDVRGLFVQGRNWRGIVTQKPQASRTTSHSLVSSLICLAVQWAMVVGAAEPYFVGYETEPIMDYGGRTVTSLHQASSRLVHNAASREDWRRYLSPLWEVPSGLLWSLVQHEVNGHGARARECDLRPGYGVGYDLSVFTYIKEEPARIDDVAVLAAGGTEANGVLAHRIIGNALSQRRLRGDTIPLLFFAKLDLSVYALSTPKPENTHESRTDFAQAYKDGNDIAVYLAARQARRVGADTSALWERDYVIDYTETALRNDYDEVQAMAAWNMIDPTLWMSLFSYVKGYLMDGQVAVDAPAIKLGDDYAVALGTRGALGAAEVSRFLDMYVLTPLGLCSVYVRDLKSTLERSMGYGACLSGLRCGDCATVSVHGDTWANPDATNIERDAHGSNVSAELALSVHAKWTVWSKLGWKSEGFFPGLPGDGGIYGGVGLSGRF